MRFLFPKWMIKETILRWANIISLGTGVCCGASLVDAGGTGGCTGDNFQCRRGATDWRRSSPEFSPLLLNKHSIAQSPRKYPLWYNMGRVTQLRLSCCLVLLSVDSKDRWQCGRGFVTWPIYYLNEMFIVRVWLVMLYIDLTTLKCSYHIDIECIYYFILCIAYCLC